MSGTNRLVLSEETLKNSSESTLTSALENANKESEKKDRKDAKKAK